MIDVGGPSMLRGAAKNFAHVAPVCSPEQYEPVLEELRASGEISPETRRRLAAEAFAHSAAYEAAIATWFNGREAFPDRLVVSLEKAQDLAYGENPHQRAAYYAERGARRHLLSRVEQLHGKELSFNNLNDLSGARSLAREFAVPACVIVKHANPCGVALGATLEEAYDKALASDPVSAYGGVVVLNREVEPALGGEARGAVRRGPVRAGLHRRGARRAAAEEEHADPPRQRAPARGARRAELQARHRRDARAGSRLPDRGSGRLGRRRGRGERAAVGRHRLRVARVQARVVERDRPRERSRRRSASAPAR